MLRTKKMAVLSSSIGMRKMSSFMDAIKSFFVHAHDLVPSQAMSDATQYRPKAPAAGVQDGPKPVIPDTESEDSAFRLAYYARDTRRPNEWHYKDAEGKPLPATPMKYMDGTPFLAKFEPAKPDYTQACVGVHEKYGSDEPIRPDAPVNMGRPYRWKTTDGTSKVISSEISRT